MTDAVLHLLRVMTQHAMLDAAALLGAPPLDAAPAPAAASKGKKRKKVKEEGSPLSHKRRRDLPPSNSHE